MPIPDWDREKAAAFINLISTADPGDCYARRRAWRTMISTHGFRVTAAPPEFLARQKEILSAALKGDPVDSADLSRYSRLVIQKLGNQRLLFLHQLGYADTDGNASRFLSRMLADIRPR